MRKNKIKTFTHRDIAVLLDENTILEEDGRELPYREVFPETKIYMTYNLFNEIWHDKKLPGQILVYDAEPMKWRKEISDKSWDYRHQNEVTILNQTSCPGDPFKLLDSLIEFRDWVEENGGSVGGSLSTTADSLFKATLNFKENGEWSTPFEKVPGITSMLGGRVLRTPRLKHSYTGDLQQWDLRSAYPKNLAKLRFGGSASRWEEVSPGSITLEKLDNLVENGVCIYVEAKVELSFENPMLAPLPIRRDTYGNRPLYANCFPESGTLDSIWTYEEIRNANRVGAKIKMKRIFIHRATGEQTFHRVWYEVMMRGRNTTKGFTQSLIKQSANSLWGRYAMKVKPSRTTTRTEKGKGVIRKDTRERMMLERNRCLELADQLSGKIRAQLFDFAYEGNMFEGAKVIQGNTDGAWISVGEKIFRPPNDDWSLKHRTPRLDILDDVSYRYVEPFYKENAGEIIYVMPGRDRRYSHQMFMRIWGNNGST